MKSNNVIVIVIVTIYIIFLLEIVPEPLYSQELRHELTVTNIAVTVNVFKGELFVSDLTIKDFEIFEDDVLQKIESVHLIRKSKVENLQPGRLFGSRSLQPEVEQSLQRRHFLLVFELDDYLMELNETINHFFNEVMTPVDTLMVITPDSAWQLKAEALDKVPREVQAEHLKTRLRKSLHQSSSELRFKYSVLNGLADDIEKAEEDGGRRDLAFIFRQAKDVIREIIHYKFIEESSLAKLSLLLTGLSGQKHVLLFHQRESIIIPMKFRKVFEEALIEESRGAVGIDRIRTLFTDAETAVHFLYLTKNKGTLNNVEYKSSGEMLSVELGGDFYQTFRNIARVTGGIIDSSANPTFQLQKTVMAVENYYLLYYRPAAYRPDGKFKNLEVRVKRPGCRVLHRTGYIVK